MTPSRSSKLILILFLTTICISLVVLVKRQSSLTQSFLHLPLFPLTAFSIGSHQSMSYLADPSFFTPICPQQKIIKFRSLQSFLDSVVTSLQEPSVILISNASTWVDCGNVLLGLQIPQKVVVTGFYNESHKHDLQLTPPFWFKYEPLDRIKSETEMYSWNVINVVGVFSLNVRFVWDSSVEPIVVENSSPLPTSFEKIQSFIKKSTLGLPITEQLIATSNKSVCGKDLPKVGSPTNTLVHFLTEKPPFTQRLKNV